MRAVAHAISVKTVKQPRPQLLPRHAKIDAQHMRAVPQALEMLVEKGDAAMMQPQALPDAVAQHETRVEH